MNNLKEQLSEALLEIHNLKENSKDIPEAKFKCETCEFMASTEAQLQDHIIVLVMRSSNDLHKKLDTNTWVFRNF